MSYQHLFLQAKNTQAALHKLNALRDQIYAIHTQIHTIKAHPYAKI